MPISKEYSENYDILYFKDSQPIKTHFISHGLPKEHKKKRQNLPLRKFYRFILHVHNSLAYTVQLVR